MNELQKQAIESNKQLACKVTYDNANTFHSWNGINATVLTNEQEKAYNELYNAIFSVTNASEKLHALLQAVPVESAPVESEFELHTRECNEDFNRNFKRLKDNETNGVITTSEFYNYKRELIQRHELELDIINKRYK
jgi:hypothetical protein